MAFFDQQNSYFHNDDRQPWACPESGILTDPYLPHPFRMKGIEESGGFFSMFTSRFVRSDMREFFKKPSASSMMDKPPPGASLSRLKIFTGHFFMNRLLTGHLPAANPEDSLRGAAYHHVQRCSMAVSLEKRVNELRVPPGRQIDLRKDYDPGYTGHYLSKQDAQDQLVTGIQNLAEQQNKLFAQDTWALLINLQAMDAAGKDSTIKHVMSGVNPQGVQVKSYKVPSAEELDHDYLWRNFLELPHRGNIGIFNRSYYEEVLVVRVHKEFLDRQQLPLPLKGRDIWERRYEEINNFEKYLTDNGIIVLKFFLNVSKETQRKRFLERIDQPDKNWKFSAADVLERRHWDAYMDAYEQMFNHTSTPWAPWYIIPADHKWFTRLAVVSVINHTLEGLKLAYPEVSPEQKEALKKAKEELEEEESPIQPVRRKKRKIID